MPTLKLYQLGAPHVELDSAHLALKPRKALALLIYLAITGESQRRDTLATLFWPEAGQRGARAALSRRLSELTGALGAGWLESDRENIGLREPSERGFVLWLDVAEFRQRLGACSTHSHPAGETCPACVSPL
ncbi:MAG TPA: hypothetical protein VGB35_04055, partial [Gammaproteobacteria bacterium]